MKLKTHFDESNNSPCRLNAFFRIGDQGHSNTAGAGIDALNVPCNVAAGQNRNIVVSLEIARENFVVTAGNGAPQVKAGIREPNVHDRGQHRRNGRKFGSIHRTVLDDVPLVVPGRNARGLDHAAHGTAVIRAIQQKRFEKARVSRNEAAAHSGNVTPLGKTREDDEIPEVAKSETLRRFQGSQRRLITEVDFAVALVAGDDEAVTLA